jgi:hypothetical protein
MTDEELVKRLRASRAVWENGRSHPTDDEAEAADRIEALLNLNEALVELMDDRDAKLAKAVEGLRTTTQILSKCLFETILVKGQYLDRKEVVASARATLAEIEGEKG